jgi:hypothetical protein
MKITISLFLLFCLFTAKEVLGQEVDITGDWTMFEMTWTSGDQVNTTTEDQLKAEGMFSDYFFMPEGKLKLVSNMTGSEKVETIDGTWKLEGDNLTTGFIMEGNPMDIVWGFEFKDDIIYLKRTAPDGSASVVNSFKRKL